MISNRDIAFADQQHEIERDPYYRSWLYTLDRRQTETGKSHNGDKTLNIEDKDNGLHSERFGRG